MSKTKSQEKIFLEVTNLEEYEPKHNWTREIIKDLATLPFPDLLMAAQLIHRKFFSPYEVQRSTLLSIKTGGCPENCSYCPQSAHYSTGVEKHKLLPKNIVKEKASAAKAQGSTRFCMGAAWREVRDGPEFDALLDLVSTVRSLDMEVCCTLGMLSKAQAERLRQAGCTAYNHNLDTSPEYYGNIITTRTYDERLRTIQAVRDAGITVCCGGIVGMGESLDDRIGLLTQLATLNPHPESVPINMLVKVEGTPLANSDDISIIDFVRIIALARITMPKSMVRLSAGRMQLSDEGHALCLLAGANSVFAGEKLLTTPNPDSDQDTELLNKLGMYWRQDSDEQRSASYELAHSLIHENIDRTQ
jgi:biotin synthase